MAPIAFYVLVLSCIVYALPPNSPLLDSYDYIGTQSLDMRLTERSAEFTNQKLAVVVGGPAGLTVANRLSEDPDVNVLLLEAGPTDNDEAFIQIPFFTGEGVGTIYDWRLETVPQIYLDGTTRAVPQGRALGGSTVINGMLWNRGSAADYDDWVNLGNPGWSWGDMLPYFIKARFKCMSTSHFK